MDGVNFIFDECLSHKLAKAISHCGKKHPLKISAKSLKMLNALETHDVHWVEKHLGPGIIGVSEDCKMINDHDIAAVVKRTNGVMFLLKNDISQKKSWFLLKWYLEHLPKLAYAAQQMKPGTTWMVNKDGNLTSVESTMPVLILEKTPDHAVAGTAS